MFACSVCFFFFLVLTGKHYFQSNEILTACLNLRTGDLRAILEELKFLRQKIQLPEELDIEFNENYDRYVQQAQNLLFKIGRLAKRIPLYRDDHSFDAPQLMDCLNRFSLWDSNIGLEPDVDYYSSDYAGEVGFSVTDEDGHATFYHQHFFPEPELAASDEAEILLVLRDRNHATATLFDSYITFVQDVLRVQTTYAEL